VNHTRVQELEEGIQMKKEENAEYMKELKSLKKSKMIILWKDWNKKVNSLKKE